MGQRMVGLCVRRWVLCTPHMNSCLCVNWTLVSVVCVLVEGEVRPIHSGPGQEGAVFGGLCEGCMCVFGVVCVCVGFEVGLYVGYGFS
jgi:hypothetical protein